MVTGLPKINLPASTICEECIIGKHPREEFPSGKSQRAQAVLELIHSDLCGPISPLSNGNKKYFISFIDDFSRKTWVYFLHDKSEAFGIFKSFTALVETETSIRIEALRTDMGGEFMSRKFNEFCQWKEVRRELTTTITPQKNGVCERKNRTIVSMIRSLLATRKVPKSFWPEVVLWAVHVLNRSLTFSVKNVTPQEAWRKKKPSVDYFKVFGCIVYAHAPDEKRKKLDDKSEKCVFLGVSESSKAYKLYNPVTKKIVASRDVIFYQGRMWDWGESN